MRMMYAVALMIASIFSLISCAATAAMEPLAPGELTVKILPDTDVEIIQTSARQDGENVVVDGLVQRTKAHGKLNLRGHVDIAILDERGKTIHETFTSISPAILPRTHEGNCEHRVKASFVAKISVKTPRLIRVSVKFHRGPHESS